MLATLAIDLLYVSGIMITCGWAVDVLQAGNGHHRSDARLATAVGCAKICRK